MSLKQKLLNLITQSLPLALVVAIILAVIGPVSPPKTPTNLPPLVVIPSNSVTPAAVTSTPRPTITQLSAKATVLVSPKPAPTAVPTQYEYHALIDPTGPIYPTESFLARINAPGGWAVATDAGQPITIAVIDTGFSLSHQALANRWVGTQGTPSWQGYDFVHGDNNPYAGRTNPTSGAVTHGTLTAGLASLLDPAARILPLQALDDNGTGYTTAIGDAVRYATDHGANVISMSLGSSYDDSYLHTQIQYAISHGVVVIAAAGNDGCDCLLYPAAYPEVLAVGASTSTDTRASFSSYGANLDVVAPGTASDVCSSLYQSTNPTTAYSCSYQGTSFAAPLVSGLAALMLQKYPTLTPASIIAAIHSSADKPAGMGGQTFATQYGYGRVNVLNALQAAGTQAASPATNQPALSMAYITINTGLRSDAVCTGPVGGTCAIKLIGPNGQTLFLGQQILNQFGQANFIWSAQQLGLQAGTWQMLTTITSGSTATSIAPQPFIVN